MRHLSHTIMRRCAISHTQQTPLFMCATWHSYMRLSVVCARWRIYEGVCVSCVWDSAFERATSLFYITLWFVRRGFRVCNMTLLYDSLICATWHSQMCLSVVCAIWRIYKWLCLSCVWESAFARATWLFHMTLSYDSFIWLFYMCNVATSYVRYD